MASQENASDGMSDFVLPCDDFPGVPRPREGVLLETCAEGLLLAKDLCSALCPGFVAITCQGCHVPHVSKECVLQLGPWPVRRRSDSLHLQANIEYLSLVCQPQMVCSARVWSHANPQLAHPMKFDEHPQSWLVANVSPLEAHAHIVYVCVLKVAFSPFKS